MRKETFEKRLSYFLNEVKRRDLRVTEPRKAILGTLIKVHGPVTAEEIYKRISRHICDLVTVYRSLMGLTDGGILKRCEFGDGVARYELVQMDLQHHHHVICISCKRIEPLNSCLLDYLNEAVQEKGFQDVTHSLEFFGTCVRCANPSAVTIPTGTC